MDKGPEVKMSLGCSMNSMEVNMAGAERARREEKEDDLRHQQGFGRF
jgi:hypothetical protein